MGNSMGGLLSIAVAAQRPGAVAALVLVNPAVPPPRGNGFGLDMITRNVVLAYGLPSPAAIRLRRLAERRGPERLVRELLELCAFDVNRIDPEVIDAHIELERARLAAGDWHIPVFTAARSLLRTLARRRKFEGWVARIIAPTLLVHGAHDHVVSPRSAHALAALRPDWEFELIDDAGHIPMLEVPGPFVEVVEAWLARTATDRSHVGAGIG
jgi:glycerol-3-phosphate dehydrogenase